MLRKYMKKICLLGDLRVGKTSLIRRFVYDTFSDEYLTTIGAKITKKAVFIGEPDPPFEFKLMIWDIAGSQTFLNLKSVHYRGASGALVVCDFSRFETTKSLANWVESLFSATENIPILFLVNKIDLKERAFGEARMEEVAKKFDAPYLFTSAKTGKNVEEAFSLLCRLMIKKEGL